MKGWMMPEVKKKANFRVSGMRLNALLSGIVPWGDNASADRKMTHNFSAGRNPRDPWQESIR